MGISVNDFWGRMRESITCKILALYQEVVSMKLRIIAAVGMAGTAMAIGFAPIAAAASPSSTITTSTSVRSHEGNAEITVEPGVSSQRAAQLQQPFGGAGNALIFHH